MSEEQIIEKIDEMLVFDTDIPVDTCRGLIAIQNIAKSKIRDSHNKRGKRNEEN